MSITLILKKVKIKIFVYTIKQQIFELKKRIKHQRLSLDQKKFLKLTIDESGLTSKQISKKYKISQSLIYKIKRSSWQHLTDKRNKDVFKIWDSDKQEIISEMIEYSKQAQEVFTAKDMADHINLKFNSFFKVEFIRKFMRNKANLRYKKIKSRPKMWILWKLEVQEDFLQLCLLKLLMITH